MSVANVPLLGAVAATAAAIPAGLYFGSTIAKPEETPAPEVELVSLKDEDEYKTSVDKFGYKFSYYFLSTKGDNNKDKWSERDAKAKAENSGLSDQGFFKDLKTAPTTNTVKSVCASKYSEAEATYTKSEDASKWTEIWKYCSLMGAKPTTIDEAKNTNENNYHSASAPSTPEKFGKKLKASVISTHDAKNNKFWELREEEFAAGRLNGATSSTYFNKDATDRKTIKVLCQDAYAKDSAAAGGATDPTETDIKRYCSLEKVS